MVGFMCVSVLGCQVYDALRQTHSTLRSVILFGCLGAMSVVPVTHWVCLENGLSPTVQVGNSSFPFILQVSPEPVIAEQESNMQSYIYFPRLSDGFLETIQMNLVARWGWW